MVFYLYIEAGGHSRSVVTVTFIISVMNVNRTDYGYDLWLDDTMAPALTYIALLFWRQVITLCDGKWPICLPVYYSYSRQCPVVLYS